MEACVGSSGAEARASATLVPMAVRCLIVLRRTISTSASMSMSSSSSNSGLILPTSNVISSTLPSPIPRSKSRRISRPPSTDAKSSCSRSEEPETPPGAAIISLSATERDFTSSTPWSTHFTPATPETSTIFLPLIRTLRCLSTNTCHCGSFLNSVLSPLVCAIAGVLTPLLTELDRVLVALSSCCVTLTESKLSGTPYSHTSLPKKPAAQSSPRSLVAGRVHGVIFVLDPREVVRLRRFGPVK